LRFQKLAFCDSQATYGANEVGDQTFAQFVSNQNGARGRNYRVTHLGDNNPNSLRNALIGSVQNPNYRVIYPYNRY
jgi:hypothetical protein